MESVDPDKWVAVERAIAETAKVVSGRLKVLEDEKANRAELVKEAEAILARKTQRKGPKQKLTKRQVEILERLQTEGNAPKRKPHSLRPAWWWKVEQLIVVLRRNVVKNAVDKIENEINYEVGSLYSWVAPKALDEAAHYRERVEAEEQAARWLLDYLAEPWLLNFIRAKLSEQTSPATGQGQTVTGGEAPVSRGGTDATATARLLSVFTNGLSDERIENAVRVLQDGTLTANDRLAKIDQLLPIPPTASAARLGQLLGVSATAVKKTVWWTENRKGEKENEVGRRHDKHRDRARQGESNRASDEDE